MLLRDVVRVEFGAEDYFIVVRYNGKFVVGIVIKLVVGVNVLDISRVVKEELNRLLVYFSVSLKTVYFYDITSFIEIFI